MFLPSGDPPLVVVEDSNAPRHPLLVVVKCDRESNKMKHVCARRGGRIALRHQKYPLSRAVVLKKSI